MGRPKNPDALRERAKRLMEAAKHLERERDDQRRRLLSELVVGHWKARFQGFETAAFRAEVERIMGGAEEPRGPGTAASPGEE